MTGMSGLHTHNQLRPKREGRPTPVLWAQTMRRAGYLSWYVGKWMNDGRPINRGYHESRGFVRRRR